MIATLRSVPRKVWLLALLALGLRVAFMIVTVDLPDENYNEFGEIAKNIRAGHGYSLFHFDGDMLSPWYAPTADPFPSAFMPPAYVFFIYPFLQLSNPVARSVLLLLVQHLAGALLVVLVFLLGRQVYSTRVACLAAMLAALLPDLVASSSTYGATVFVHVLLVGMFLYMAQHEQRSNFTRAMLPGVLLGLLVLFRFEALALALVFFVLIYRSHGILILGKAALVFMLILAPWIVRNTFVFEQPILSTSLGLNLYRGNNAQSIGAWSDPQIDEILPALAGRRFEVRMNDVYLNRTLPYIVQNPASTLIRSGQKVFRLWTFDPDDSRSKHPLRLVAWAFLLIFAVIGWMAVRPPPYIVAFLVYATVMAAIFFSLARHQVLMEIALLLPAAHGLVRFSTFTGLYSKERSSATP